MLALFPCDLSAETEQDNMEHAQPFWWKNCSKISDTSSRIEDRVAVGTMIDIVQLRISRARLVGVHLAPLHMRPWTLQHPAGTGAGLDSILAEPPQ